MKDCLFCKITDKALSAEIIYEDERTLAFWDINPAAPVHILVIPKKHIATINDLEDSDAGLVADMYMTAKRIARQEGLSENGYRLVMNCNADAGQTVFHIHLHLLGGRPMQWPPG
jgi:histidine triad (HIT) family protein